MEHTNTYCVKNITVWLCHNRVNTRNKSTLKEATLIMNLTLKQISEVDTQKTCLCLHNKDKVHEHQQTNKKKLLILF